MIEAGGNIHQILPDPMKKLEERNKHLFKLLQNTAPSTNSNTPLFSPEYKSPSEPDLESIILGKPDNKVLEKMLTGGLRNRQRVCKKK